MDEQESEARRKEREQNEIPKGPEWLWNPWWWVGIIGFAVAMLIVRYR